MSDITLTASARTNLLAIQNNTTLIDRTSHRLSTGKRVNEATDDVRAFFLAKALTSRVGDLMALKQPIDQSLSAIGGALVSIDAIAQLVDQMKATVNEALGQSAASRSELAARFNTLRTQLDAIAADAGYKGVNLLNASPQDLKVTFDQSSGSSLTIPGIASDSASLGIGDSAGVFNSFATDADIEAAINALDTAVTTLRSTATQVGNSAGVLSTRLDFTEGMVNTLENGVGKLVGADFNEEAASLLALNVARELAVSSLNIANQSQRAILKLF